MFSALIVALFVCFVTPTNVKSLDSGKKLKSGYVTGFIYDIQSFMCRKAPSVDGFYPLVEAMRLIDTHGSSLKFRLHARASNCSKSAKLTLDEVNSPICSGRGSTTHLYCDGKLKQYKGWWFYSRYSTKVKMACVPSAVKRIE